VLFTYAPGIHPPYPPSAEDCRRYGRAVAEVHNGLEDFSSLHPRFALDAGYLIEQPLRAILPFLEHRPADQAYLQQLADQLTARVALVDETLERGACHGDFHGGNCHVAE